jgi:hypothetical protein
MDPRGTVLLSGESDQLAGNANDDYVVVVLWIPKTRVPCES